MEIALLLIGVALVAWSVYAFNRLVRLRNQMRAGWADVDVQLARRHALVPQLVKAVGAYAGHERATLEAVTALRARAEARKGPEGAGEAEAELEQGLVRLLALREAYPELKADRNFEQLQRELVEIEDHLQYARRFYNGAVRDYQTAIQRFPEVLVARALGFEPGAFFQASEEERGGVRVEMRP